MENKFEGFEGCFRMSINTTNSNSLQRLRDVNDSRKQLNVKIAKGTVTKYDMMNQLKVELDIFDTFIKIIDSKMKEMKCCAVINNVISILTKRINHMWNTIFLLFTINDNQEPEFITFSNNYTMSSCASCNTCSISIESILSNIDIVSIKGDTVFNFSSSDFIKICQTTAFVDKTLMIKEVFRTKEIKGTVITAPRKYGKSTNLSMLKYFLEIQVDSLGKPLTKAATGKPITDTSNYKLFEGLKIRKETNIMNKHFGKYPVLYANFKIENTIKSYYCAVEGCKEVIHESFKLHNYLQKSSKLNNEQKKLCTFWCGNASYKRSNFDQIVFGLRSLCTFLSKHYNKPCFVLIDELDFLTMAVTITETLIEDYKSIFMFLKEVLFFLKNNKIVVKAFVTGKSVDAIYGIVPSCIQIKPFAKCHEFTDYYGLTLNELEYLFRKPEFIAVPTIEEVKAYYGTYNKFDCLKKTNNQIYCIWSILNVLNHRRLDNYWQDFGNFFCIFSNTCFKTIVQKLLINEHMLVTLYDTTKPRTYPVPPPIFEASDILDKPSLDYLFNLMLDFGYMTCSSSIIKVIDFYRSINTCLGCIRVPNEEVRQDIENKISLLS